MDAALLERAKHPDLRVGHGILADTVLGAGGRFVLVSQPEPLEHVSSSIRDAATTTLLADSLDEAALEAHAGSLPEVERIVGIGGGVTMDTAKYLAWRCGLPLLLAPSIVSVDASVTNTVAIRRGGHVEYDGFVVADRIVADLQLISRAPKRLNRAGVGDLLSIQTGRRDWALGARAGTVDFDADVDAAAAEVLEELYLMADEVAAVTDRAIEHIITAYARINALLLEVGHSGPEEGSEHYFGYAAERVTSRTFVHGELIGLGTVLMSGLQDNDQVRAAAFLDGCRVAWRPEQLGLDAATLERILLALPGFVREAGLPHSVIDERPLERDTVAQLLASIPPRPRPLAASSQEDHR